MEIILLLILVAVVIAASAIQTSLAEIRSTLQGIRSVLASQAEHFQSLDNGISRVGKGIGELNAYAGEVTGLTATDAYRRSIERMNSRYQQPARKSKRVRPPTEPGDELPYSFTYSRNAIVQALKMLGLAREHTSYSL